MVTNITIKKAEILWELSQCDTETQKQAQAVGKMVPADLLDTGVPQTFLLYKMKSPWRAVKQGMPVLGELHHWKDSKDNLFQLPHFLVEETEIKRLYNSVLRSHTSYQWSFHDNTHGLLFFFFFFLLSSLKSNVFHFMDLFIQQTLSTYLHV